MLKTFYVQNYRNLKFAEPLSIDNITGVYGVCASGKSNFCRALSDIACACAAGNIANDKDSLFYYVFEYDGVDAELHYRKDKAGVISFARFLIAETQTDIISMIKSKDIKAHLACIRKKILADGMLYAVSLVDRLLNEIEGIWVSVDEMYGASAGLRDSASVVISENCAKWHQNEDRIKRASLIIYDDIETRSDLAEGFMEKVMAAGGPVICTTRRTEWIERYCRRVEDCVLIQAGNVARAADISSKDLRTIKQLTVFLKNF